MESRFREPQRYYMDLTSYLSYVSDELSWDSVPMREC